MEQTKEFQRQLDMAWERGKDFGFYKGMFIATGIIVGSQLIYILLWK